MTGRPTRALINLDNLKANFMELKALAEGSTQVMAVVKADAYGHGDKVIAKALDGFGCDVFGVAMLEEGIRLREAGIKKPIVILGGLLIKSKKDNVKFGKLLITIGAGFGLIGLIIFVVLTIMGDDPTAGLFGVLGIGFIGLIFSIVARQKAE